MDKKIVGIIPARGGSKGIPRKNLYDFCGKPLIAYTIEAGLNSKYIDKVVLSTEDQEIADVARKYGAEVIERPAELAQDATKTALVLVQVVDELKKQGYNPDIIVTLQPTSPLRKADVVDEVIEKLLNSDCDSVFGGNKVFKYQPRWDRDENGNLNALYDYHLRPRRQDVKEFCYEENGAVYAITSEAFDKYHDMLGNKVEVVEMSDIDSVELDTKFDLLLIEQLMKYLNQ
jgi:CMP-N,N'-diacetyllegionaminic acid synthase